MRLPLSIITRAVFAAALASALSGALAGCGTKTPLMLPPAPTPAAKPQPAQPSPDHHSNAPGTSQ
ncbi:MAG: hypothetical protein NTY41_10400 [Proteobacteria bacterium]|nr:hypothetical protein [Pseudomonadota bacterium]